MNKDKKIVVIGAGIAGSSTAIGLKKLGFDVTVIYKQRPFVAYEGFSQKTKNGLAMFGCKSAANLLQKQSMRNSNWANQSAHVNYEYVVNRNDLDTALLKDMQIKDIKIINAKVVDTYYESTPKISYKIDNEIKELKCDFIVETRGRFTPFKNEYKYGPKSFSILQELEFQSEDKARTSIDSIKDGWVWQAYIGANKGYLQFSCDEAIANRITSFDDVLEYLKNHNINLWSLQNYKTKGKLVKRDSYSKIHKTIVNEKMILIGDAASSIDPLSGNGAYQAMSMSSIAPFVINTIINKKENSQIAIDFYKSRVEFIFNKFAHIGKDFYQLEKRFDSEYWQTRQSWPKDELTVNYNPIIKESAIVKDGFIFPKDVVITKDNPLGVFFYKNIEIVPIVKYCLSNNYQDSINYIDIQIKDEIINQNLKQWLIEQNIL